MPVTVNRFDEWLSKQNEAAEARQLAALDQYPEALAYAQEHGMFLGKSRREFTLHCPDERPKAGRPRPEKVGDLNVVIWKAYINVKEQAVAICYDVDIFSGRPTLGYLALARPWTLLQAVTRIIEKEAQRGR